MKPALVLVDLQQDYLSAEGLEPPADRVVAAAAALLRWARAQGLPVLHVRTTVRRDDDRRMPHWRRAGKWLCVEGTPGHAPPAPLAPAPAEPVFDKRFWSAFDAEGLEAALRAATGREVILAGVHLHACVRSTALDAYARGYEVVVADDAVASDDPLHAAATRRWLAARGTRFRTVAEIAGRPAPAGDPAAAVAAACDASAAWRAAPPGDRAALLDRVAALLEADAVPLAEAMAMRLGKPVRHGREEVAFAAALVRAAARRAAAPAQGRRLPHGVVAVVTPWNNPVAIPLGKIAPALAFGNTVAWKPAHAAEPLARAVEALFRCADAPEGVLGLVTGGADAARALMDDSRVAAITLTGSSAAGFAAQEAAARRRVPLQAELGGNNAAIVWADADLVRAAAAVAEGAFAQAGQRCTANRRAVVDERCAGTFLERLRDATAALVVGDPLDPATDVGPLVSPEARDRVAAAVARARADGHGVTVPHARVPEGHYLAPTIVECDEPSHPVVQEELFGPVLVVQRARDFAHALALLNGVGQGLAASLFSASPDRRARFLDEAVAGVLKLDQATAGAGVEEPFGGWKASGVGPPEHGAGDLEFFTRPQALYGRIAPHVGDG